MDWHETALRVRYKETDKMGVVHHSNYLVWFEIGRSEICRARGFSYADMEKDNVILVVGESYCRYKSPAFYEDELIIKTRLQDLKTRSMRFVYQIFRESDQTVIAEGETLHVVTNSDLKVCSLPEKYRLLLTAEIDQHISEI